MPASKTLQALIAGRPPKSVRLAAARGLVPLAPDEMLAGLVHLSADAEPEIAAEAAATLGGWAEGELCTQLRAAGCAPAVLEYFAAQPASEAVREAVVTNPATPGAAVAAIARESSARILDLILDNRMRLLEAPEILGAIRGNARASAEAARIVAEIEAEFLDSRKSDYRVERLEEEVAPTESPTDPATELAPEDFLLEGLPVDPEERELALLQRLMQMTVQQKIRAALLGNREMRSVLVRSVNREVSSSVLKNPRLTDSEVESFAAMRNVSEEILREIGGSREWTRHYNVVQNLARNPKTPPIVSQRLLFRLQSRDLTLLSRDRGVPELVRRHAQRTLAQRNAK